MSTARHGEDEPEERRRTRPLCVMRFSRLMGVASTLQTSAKARIRYVKGDMLVWGKDGAEDGEGG